MGKDTSDKWVLETVKGVKIDVNNVKKVPLNDQSFSENFSQTVISLIGKKNQSTIKEKCNYWSKWNGIRLSFSNISKRKERQQLQVDIEP